MKLFLCVLALAIGFLFVAQASPAQTSPSAPTPPTPAAAAASLAPEAIEADAEPRVDTRTQYPMFFAHSYFSFSPGYLRYDFSSRQLEPGFTVESVDVPHAAARVALFGHEFNRFLSAQLSYARPVNFISYRNVNGDRESHHVWVAFGSATVRPQLPVQRRLSLYGEAGVGITSRRGFDVDGEAAVKDATFASLLVGGGIDVHVTPAWDLTAGMTYSPQNVRLNQPHAMLWSGGFRFNVLPLSNERLAAKAGSDDRFPANIVQAEYAFGVAYGINTFLSEKVPIFWGGTARVAKGGALHYQHNVFHTPKVFALDLGTSASIWKSRDLSDHFVTLSVYPLLRWTLLRTGPADLYVCYSLAGPTFISKTIIDGLDTGRRFTFQDFMGAGVFIGRNKRMVAGIKINHYSNGSIFAENAGVKVPLTATLGYTF